MHPCKHVSAAVDHRQGKCRSGHRHASTALLVIVDDSGWSWSWQEQAELRGVKFVDGNFRLSHSVHLMLLIRAVAARQAEDQPYENFFLLK